MSDVSCERAYVPNLRATDNATALRQAGAVAPDPGVIDDLRVRDATADYDETVLLRDCAETADTRGVDEGVEWAPETPARLDEQVGPAADNARPAIVSVQHGEGLFHGGRRVIVQ